jgi:quinol monooxygenase YgiN
VATADESGERTRTAVVTLLRVDCRDAAAADEFDRLTAAVFEHAADHEPGTLVFARHVVVGRPLSRVFYEIYQDQAAARIHAGSAALRRLVERQGELIAEYQIDQLAIGLAKGMPPI